MQGVIEELGYTSSLAARSTRSRKTNVIGLITPDVGDPFSIQVMKGVNRAIAQLDYDLIIYTGGGIKKESFADRERRYVSLLNSNITDGIIVVTPLQPPSPLSPPLQLSIPTTSAPISLPLSPLTTLGL